MLRESFSFHQFFLIVTAEKILGKEIVMTIQNLKKMFIYIENEPER